MMLGRVALDLWMADVVLSLISIGAGLVLWAWVSVLTVAGAARRARRRPRQLGALRDRYPPSELAGIDEALERILAEERGVLPGWRA